VPNLGMGELVVILMLVVLIFGATRLPQLGEGIGKAIANFKRAVGGDDDSGSAPRDENGDA
jgi:sec-independent protein translocase protein TatA